MDTGGFQDSGGLDPDRDASRVEVGQQPGSGDQDRHNEEHCSIYAPPARAFMLLPEEAFAQHSPGVMDTPEQIRRWLLATMERTGWSAAKWASKADVAASTVQRAIRPTYEFVTSSRTLAKLAAAAKTEPPELAPETSPSATTILKPTFLEIRYEVGAGMWRRVEDLTESYGSAPVTADPAYSGAAQWLERVVSDSMDLEYPVGTLLHVVDATTIHYSLAHQDHVIIERRSQGGGMVERTVKEVVFTANGPEFWGRSTNPKWNVAADLLTLAEDETLEVEVVGLVLGSYRGRRKT